MRSDCFAKRRLGCSIAGDLAVEFDDRDPFAVDGHAMGSGVAVGGAGVNVGAGVEVGPEGKREAHAESPSAVRESEISQ